MAQQPLRVTNIAVVCPRARGAVRRAARCSHGLATRDSRIATSPQPSGSWTTREGIARSGSPAGGTLQGSASVLLSSRDADPGGNRLPSRAQRGDGEGLGGDQSPWKERAHRVGNGSGCNGLVGGARPRRQPPARSDIRHVLVADRVATPFSSSRPPRRCAGSPVSRRGPRAAAGTLPKRVGEVEACSSGSSFPAGEGPTHRAVLAASGVGRAQGQGGNGRGDTVRLSTRGTLRRVLARLGGSARPGAQASGRVMPERS